MGYKESSHLAVGARRLVRRAHGACGVPEATRGCGAEYAPGARVPCTCPRRKGCPAPRSQGCPARLPCSLTRTARYLVHVVARHVVARYVKARHVVAPLRRYSTRCTLLH